MEILFVIIGYIILYLIVRSAINDSPIFKENNELLAEIRNLLIEIRNQNEKK